MNANSVYTDYWQEVEELERAALAARYGAEGKFRDPDSLADFVREAANKWEREAEPLALDSIPKLRIACRTLIDHLEPIAKWQATLECQFSFVPPIGRDYRPNGLIRELWRIARTLDSGSSLPALPLGDVAVNDAIILLHRLHDWCTDRARSRASHSIDFRSANWFGTHYSFSQNQAACVKVLWEAWEAGAPEVGKVALLEAIDHAVPPERLDLQFRDHPAWNTMIVSGRTKGVYCLAEPEKVPTGAK